MTQQTKRPNLLPYLLVLLVLVGVYGFMNKPVEAEPSYAEVRELFESEQVSAFTVTDTTLRMKLREPIDGKTELKKDLFSVTLFYDDLGELIEQQKADGIIEDYDFTADHSINYVAMFAPYILAVLGIFAIWYFLSVRSAGGGGGDRMAKFGTASFKTGGDNKRPTTFSDVAGADEEKEELKRQVAELTDRLQQQQNATPTADDQMALLEKSYELAARYMNDGGQNGQVAQVPVAGGIERKPDAVTVQAIRETTVSGLQQPMSDADFIRAYSQPRNYGFNTAVGTGYAMGKNTVAACIHQDQTLVDGQAVKLRLLEPMQAGNIVVPKNTLVAGTAKVQGERLDILVSSIEYAGNIISVELAVFDTDGQKGLSVPSSMEQEAFNEAMANIGSGLGTSISFAQSAGQQVAMDVTRGLLQGTSGYLAKKFRTVKVKLKAGYKVMLYAKQQ